LDEDGGLSGDESLLVDLSALEEYGITFRGLQVLGEDLTHFSDYGGGLFVFTNLLFEFFLLFLSLVIEVVEVLVVSSELSFLGGDDTLEDFTGRVEGSLKFGLKLGLLGVGFSEVLIKSTDIEVATSLEVSVCSIIFLLLGNKLILKVGKGGQQIVKGVVSLQLKPNGVQ